MKIIMLILMFVFSAMAMAKDIALPEKVSGLHGWNGLKIVKSKRCSTCKELVFPKGFGFNNRHQMSIILLLINNRRAMSVDVDGILPVNYFALDHLVDLAINHNDLTVVKLIFRGRYTKEIKVDGELAQNYEFSRIFPVLQNVKKAPRIFKEIVDNKHKKDIAEKFCYFASLEDGGIKKMYVFSDLMKNRGAVVFAKEIVEACIKYDFDYWVNQ